MRQIELVASYLPSTVVSFLLDHDTPATAPVRQTFSTVCMFADVSGFTALSEAMSKYGPEGAEYLAKHLNNYFSQMVKIIASMGGDIFKFAGDAMLVLWPDNAEMRLEERVQRAGQCALEIQSNLHAAELQDGVTLSVKIGIGVGDVSVLHLGGVLRRMEYVAVGEPLVQAFAAEHHCDKGGEVVLSPKAWGLVSAAFRAVTMIEDGNVRIARDGKGECLRPVRKIALTSALRSRLEEVGEEAEKRLRNYVAGAILPWLNPDAPEQEVWGCDLRNVTVLFVNLGLKDMDMLAASKYDDAMGRMHSVLRAAQGAVYQYEGAVNKCLNDDKGSTMIAVFGLPPLSHEDDATRGVLCGLAICERLWALGLVASVGITTGVVFCGVVGSITRKEYTILGDTVNLSARLMQKAGEYGGGVLCDLQIRRAASQGLAFQELDPVNVKGKTAKIRNYRPYPAGLMKDLPQRAAPATEPSALRMAYEAQLVGYRVHRLLRPLELPPPIAGDGLKDPGEVEAAARDSAAAAAAAAAGGAPAMGGGGLGGARVASTSGASARRQTNMFAGGTSGRGSMLPAGAAGAGAGDHVLTVAEVFGPTHITASGSSSDGEAAVDEDGVPIADLFTVNRRIKDSMAAVFGAPDAAAAASAAGAGGVDAARKRAGTGSAKAGGSSSSSSSGASPHSSSPHSSSSHLSRPDLPLTKMRCLLAKPPAPVSVSNAAFRGLPTIYALRVHVPNDLAAADALDVRVSYDLADGAHLPDTIPVRASDDDAAAGGAELDDAAAAADGAAGGGPARSLAGLRDAAVAAAKAAGRVHGSVPSGDFLLRLHGSDALVPVSYSLPLLWLWVFVLESGATVVDDAVSADNTLSVQLVRVRDVHVLQNMQAAAMQRLLEGKLALVSTRQGCAAVIEAEFGLGKTALLSRFVGDVMPGTTSVFCAAGSPYTRMVPFAVWTELLQQFLREYRDAKGLPSVTHAAGELLVAHAVSPAVLALGSLLNAVLDTELPPHPLADALKPRQRDRVVRGLLLSLLRGMTAETAAVIVIDDGVFMHRHSWELARDVAAAATLPPGTPGALAVQLVLATRPIPYYLDVVAPETPPAYLRLLNTQAVSLVRLSRVPPGDAAMVLAAVARWGGLMSQDVIRLVEGKTHGNPAMIAEVVLSLIGHGRLQAVELASPAAQAAGGGAMVATGLYRLLAMHARAAGMRKDKDDGASAASRHPLMTVQPSFRVLYKASNLAPRTPKTSGGRLGAIGEDAEAAGGGGGEEAASSERTLAAVAAAASSSSPEGGSGTTAADAAASRAAMMAQAAVAAGAGLARLGVGWVSVAGLLGPIGGLLHRKQPLLGCDPTTGAPSAVLVLKEGLAATHVPYCRRSHWSISTRVDRLPIFQQLVLKAASLIGKQMRATTAAVNPAATAATPLALLAAGGGSGGAMASAAAAMAGGGGLAAGAARGGVALMGAAGASGPSNAAAAESGGIGASSLAADAVVSADSLTRRRMTLAGGSKAAMMALATSAGDKQSTGGGGGASDRFNISFRFEILAQCFPIDAVDRKALAALCVALERVGLLTHGYVRGLPGSAAGGGQLAEAVFTFNSGFLPDTVRFRMLAAQKEGLQKKIRECIEVYEDSLRKRMMDKLIDSSGALMAAAGGAGAGGGVHAAQRSAWMLVRKNPESATVFTSMFTRGAPVKEWKRRWLVLLQDKLEMYKEQPDPGAAAAGDPAHQPVQSIYLRGAVATLMPGGDSDLREKMGAINIVQINVQGWEKKGRVAGAGRTFFVSAESRADAEDWCMWIKTTAGVFAERARGGGAGGGGGRGGGARAAPAPAVGAAAVAGAGGGAATAAAGAAAGVGISAADLAGARALLELFAPSPSGLAALGNRLLLSVEEAQRLTPAKPAGVPNVYVTLQLDEATLTTPTAPGTLDPIWACPLAFPVSATQAARGQVTVRVWDRDREGADQLMGVATLRLASLQPRVIDAAEEEEEAARRRKELEDAEAAAAEGGGGGDAAAAVAAAATAVAVVADGSITPGRQAEAERQAAEAELVLYLSAHRGMSAFCTPPVAVSGASEGLSFRASQGFPAKDHSGRTYPVPGYGVIVLRARLLLTAPAFAECSALRAATAALASGSGTVFSSSDDLSVPVRDRVLSSWREAASATASSSGGGGGVSGAASPLLVEDDFEWAGDAALACAAEEDAAAAASAGGGGGGGGAIDSAAASAILGAGASSFYAPNGRMRPASTRYHAVGASVRDVAAAATSSLAASNVSRGSSVKIVPYGAAGSPGSSLRSPGGEVIVPQLPLALGGAGTHSSRQSRSSLVAHTLGALVSAGSFSGGLVGPQGAAGGGSGGKRASFAAALNGAARASMFGAPQQQQQQAGLDQALTRLSSLLGILGGAAAAEGGGGVRISVGRSGAQSTVAESTRPASIRAKGAGAAARKSGGGGSWGADDASDDSEDDAEAAEAVSGEAGLDGLEGQDHAVRLSSGELTEACSALSTILSTLRGGGGGGGDAGGEGSGAETTRLVLGAMTAMEVDGQSRQWLTSTYMRNTGESERGGEGDRGGEAPAPGTAPSSAASSFSSSRRSATAGASSPPVTTAGGRPLAPVAAPTAPAPAPAAAAPAPAVAPRPSVLSQVHDNALAMPFAQRTLSVPGDLVAGPGSDEAGSGWLGWGLHHLGGVYLGAITPEHAAAAGDGPSAVAAPAPLDERAFAVRLSDAELRGRQRTLDACDRIFYEDGEDKMHGPFSARQMVNWVADGYMPVDSGVRVGWASQPPVALETVLPQLRVRALVSRARELGALGGSLDGWTFDLGALGADAAPPPAGSGAEAAAAAARALLPVPAYVLARLRLPRFFALPEAATVSFLDAVCVHMSLRPDATPYHNFAHAVDVMQSVNALLVQMNAAKLFTPVETLALVLAALCHDLEHPGVNNAYLVNAGAELALRYNDASVLESHHAAAMFGLVGKHRLCEGLSRPQYKEFRRVALAAVLATDMTCHFSLTDELKGVGLANAPRIRYLLSTRTAFHHRPANQQYQHRQGGGGDGGGSSSALFSFSDDDLAASAGDAGPSSMSPVLPRGTAEELADVSAPDRLVVLKNLLHAADISNPTKPWPVCKAWSDRVLEEFYAQGDRERREGLPVSPNCDRATVRQSQMSVNFIDFVVAPLFIALAALLPGAQLCVDLLAGNRATWSEALKAEIVRDAAATPAAREEAVRQLARRDTVFAQVLMPLVQEAAAEAEEEDREKGDDDDDDDAGWGGEGSEAAQTARVLSLNAIETFVSAAAAGEPPR